MSAPETEHLEMQFDESRTLADIDKKLDYLLSEVTALKSLVTDIIPEVKPMIDQLTNSPIFRMMTGGKKK